MKKNVLAVALVAGLGLAGAAAAYNYGTDPARSTPENVAYQMLFAPNYNYTMTEAIVFDIDPADNAVNFTQGFTVRVKLNRTCPGGPFQTAGVPDPSTCTDTTDGALFDTSWTPTAQGYDTMGNPVGPAGNGLALDASLIATWDVAFDAYYDGGRTASFRITPKQGITNPQNPSSGTLLSWSNAHLTSLNEFANAATTKVDAEFWMINTTNDDRFVNSTKWGPILNRVSGVAACANSEGSEVDKYIDVADDFNEDQIPKTRFSWDGKLGSANDSNGGTVQAPGDYDSQVIDLGDVTITNTGAGSFAFLANDAFTTVITGSNGDDWNAFENGAGVDDDVYLFNGTCTSGTLVDQGTISGNSVTFNYTGGAALLPLTTGASTTYLTVCAFQDTNIVIDDHPNHVTTQFTRANAVATPLQGDVHLGNGPDVCDLLPLRYNGSTMEIFTINPGSNTTQRSFIRLTNRSQTDGYVSLEGIDNAGVRGASQVRVWVEAGASVQLDASDLENGTNGAIGAWGAPSDGKWRAVVTAEFPGLVATSLVNSALPRVLTNITDSDTRGEQNSRDWTEGTFGNEPGERSADFTQEWAPDFHGNGSETGEPGGPNGSDGPSGGQTEADGNPGVFGGP